MLILTTLIGAGLQGRYDPPPRRSRPLLPTIVVGTAFSAIAVGSQEPLAGVGVAYVATLWLCARYWHHLDR